MVEGGFYTFARLPESVIHDFPISSHFDFIFARGLLLRVWLYSGHLGLQAALVRQREDRIRHIEVGQTEEMSLTVTVLRRRIIFQ